MTFADWIDKQGKAYSYRRVAKDWRVSHVTCEVCHEPKAFGHNPDCELRKLIDAEERPSYKRAKLLKDSE